MSVESVETQRRFPRRLLIGAATAVAAAGATQTLPGTAAAASGSTAWKLGGNNGVTTTGSNFIGPTKVAPLVFKTRSARSKPVTERLRITPAGLLGVGTKTPGAQVDVRTSFSVAIRGTTTPTSPAPCRRRPVRSRSTTRWIPRGRGSPTPSSSRRT